MPTIPQLPSADTVSASDLLPISQGGSTHAVSVGALLGQTQPAIIIGPPSLLGRYSIGPGGPDTIAVGDGLALNNGTLTSNGFDVDSLPVQTTLASGDQIIVNSGGVSQLLDVNQLRDLFTAGSNITIDTNGTISSAASNDGSTYSLTALTTVGTIATGDLVGLSQSGQDHTITYGNFIDGVTIDSAQAAGSATDSDAFWVAQTSNIMVRQSLGAIWPWVCAKLGSWQRPVIELSVNTALSTIPHNNAILVCSSPIAVSAANANLVSGFSCELVNVSTGPITFSGNILTSNGQNSLSPCQCAGIRCVAYSVGTAVFASMSAGNSAMASPGQPSNLTASMTTATSISLSWSAPPSGGSVTAFSVQYRVTGSTAWLAAGLTNADQNFPIGGLEPSTSYDFTVIAVNNVGAGSASTILTVTTQ
jgi:fibronectin type III domain protein